MQVFSTLLLAIAVSALTVNIPAWQSSMTSLAGALATATGDNRASLLSQFNALGTLPGYVVTVNTDAASQATPSSVSIDYSSFHAWESAMLSEAQSLATATGSARSSLLSGMSSLQATPGVIPSTTAASAEQTATSGGNVETLTISGSTSVVTVPPSGTTIDGVTIEPSSTSTGTAPESTSSKSESTTAAAASTGSSSGISSSTSKGVAATQIPDAGGLAIAILGMVALL